MRVRKTNGLENETGSDKMKVYICPNSTEIYHTRICNAMSTYKRTHKVDLESVEDRRRKCKVCQNGPQGPQDQDWETNNKLRETDPEDIDAFK